MRKNSSQAHKLLQNLRDNRRLGSHLRAFATSLVEDGYADETVQLKLGLLVLRQREPESAGQQDFGGRNSGPRRGNESTL